MWNEPDNLVWEILLKLLCVPYSSKTMYHNCDISICFCIIFQDEQNGDNNMNNLEQHSLNS